MNDLNHAFLAQDQEHQFGISPITDIINDIRTGRMVVLVDEEDRENEGDLVIAAEFVTHEHINFMAMHGRGLICLTLTESRCKQLNLSRMVERNGTRLGTNFTASIEAARGVTTGISAADRAVTIQAAVKADAKASDIVSPGHVFPLIAQNDGVLVRAGHTEAGCDLARMAGLEPASVICEILNEDGSMARLPDLRRFAAEHGLKIGTIADLIRYRSQTETLVERAAERSIQTPYGEFRLVAYRDRTADETHLALVKGDPAMTRDTLVRVHEPVSVLDLLDCENRSHAWSVPRAMEAIQQAEAGVIVLLRRPEDEANLIERIRMPEEPFRSRHTLRDYGIGAQILRDLGVTGMRLLAVPRKIPSMAGFGLEILEFIDC
ncbi:3,4-dihydroxy-2-butanone-4-phosphate synthase [Methylobacillus sp. MM3]|jgi:3,4-dihydroxy 2-butanone 4-phosphate synthase/GTP cyclohydrolase II|uniref:bifunctional 3,4-dihydroxy-2-butanone-4-phosphate synthase/GTP cyclohydrolase II n=1 Tax=Methylobacillus sp. MM3 TaxID=1848039 RepID=UPI0007DFFF2A|nr:bifunctional 3,4-dihydroxy-2-butanone-4-phosphate synthase/GTP cyclohydrolase II [Methylobacillus sp. MM3]OAJ71547.1 3,4-dihydroxy-2-butanone-4-phosphate synthase [Methylobacillus sp. MM3]